MRRIILFILVGCFILATVYFTPLEQQSSEASDSPLFQASLASTKNGMMNRQVQGKVPEGARQVRLETCELTCAVTCTGSETCGITCLETCESTCAHTCSQVTCLNSCGSVTCEVTCMETCQATCANTCGTPTCEITCVATCDYTCISTQIALVTFSAVPQADRIELHWITASEFSNYGFRLRRALAEDEDYEIIAEILSQSSGIATTSYVFEDRDVSPGVTYYYKLSDIDLSGNEVIHPEIVSATPGWPPGVFEHRNFPNPFNPLTTIRFNLEQSSPVNLKVYDFRGRVIADLFDGPCEAGMHEILFDGSELHSGVYIYRIRAGKNIASGRMVLMK